MPFVSEVTRQTADSADTAWLKKSFDRAITALRASHAPSDRLVLVREAARLSGGRLDLAALHISLTSEEEEGLKRFGLERATGDAVRVLTENLNEIAPGLEQALTLDPRPRNLFEAGAPDAALRRCMDHPSYTSVTQKAATSALLTMPDGATLMVSMPTGSGKSLLFQLAPLWWRRDEPGACIIVIVPTVALAEDHERTLRAIPGLQGSRALTGALDHGQRDEILLAFRRGEVPVLFLSPEAAFGSARAGLLNAAAPSEDKFGLGARLLAVFVDEAHIIESWGRTFRPDFQRLPGLIDALALLNPRLKTILLSATLTPAAKNVLRSTYSRGEWLEIDARAPRYDFDLAVAGFETEAERDVALLAAIDKIPRPAIVYTTRVDQAAALYERLTKSRGYARVALFTGEIAGPERRRVIQGWADQKFDLVIATSAFGLGVDKGDVRAVVHACLPETPARWYQEVGRASRDGHQGLGLTLYTRTRPDERARRRAAEDSDEQESRSDEELARSLAGAGWLSREKAEARWRALRASCSPTWGADGHRHLTLSLDAARDGLGRFTGEYNRGWNRSLLNLMQRAGVVEIEAEPAVEAATAVEGPEPETWEIILLEDSLVSEGEAWTEVWDRIYAVRDSEKRQATGELDRFRQVMSGTVEACLLAETFGLIEPGVDAPDCGRCENCRSRNQRPPTIVQPAGASSVWSRAMAPSATLGAGLILVAPDPLSNDDLLLARLVHAGIEQIITAPDHVADVAQTLAESSARFGFVQDAADWIANARILPNVPTAIVTGDKSRLAAIVRGAQDLARQRPGQSLVMAADPGSAVNGRSLYQFASQQAPIAEEMLDELALPIPSESQ